MTEVVAPRLAASATRRHLVAAGLAAAIGILLLALSVPRLIAVIVSANAEPTLRKLQSQQPVTLDEVRTLASALERASVWVGDGRLRTDLGLAYLLIAEKLPRESGDARQSLDLAVQSLRDGLSRSPANPYAWARLAYAEALLSGGWSTDAVAALRLALITAPYEPRLLWWRLRMALFAWPQLGERDQELVLQQIRYAWQANPSQLAELALEVHQVNVVRAALLRTPDALNAFEDLLRAHKS